MTIDFELGLGHVVGAAIWLVGSHVAGRKLNDGCLMLLLIPPIALLGGCVSFAIGLHALFNRTHGFEIAAISAFLNVATGTVVGLVIAVITRFSARR